MKAGGKPVLLLVTAATRDEAENLGEALLERGLATRGSVIPGVHSFWMREDRLERSHEAMLLASTSSDKARAAADFIRQNHSFEEPLVLTLPLGE